MSQTDIQERRNAVEEQIRETLLQMEALEDRLERLHGELGEAVPWTETDFVSISRIGPIPAPKDGVCLVTLERKGDGVQQVRVYRSSWSLPGCQGVGSWINPGYPPGFASPGDWGAVISWGKVPDAVVVVDPGDEEES